MIGNTRTNARPTTASWSMNVGPPHSTRLSDEFSRLSPIIHSLPGGTSTGPKSDVVWPVGDLSLL